MDRRSSIVRSAGALATVSLGGSLRMANAVDGIYGEYQ
jgi:hypothetical protein